MGYYTYYSLDIKGTKEEATRAIDYINKEILCDFNPFKLYDYNQSTRISFCEPQDQMKWYSYREDMINVSLLFPNLTFRLSGNGEEPGDLWDEYFYNGKQERCEAIIPPPTIIEW